MTGKGWGRLFDFQTATAPHCNLRRWIVTDRPSLVVAVGEVLRGRADHIEAVLRSLAQFRPGMPRGTSIDEAIADLTRTSGLTVEHRDGWIFQIISWLAAMSSNAGDSIVSIPQRRPADKGFDHLIVMLDAVDLRLSGVIIGEDKATVNPRTTIRTEVWPAIQALEAKDRELEAELSALLRTRFSLGSPEIQLVVDGIIQQRRRGYRVSVTALEKHTRPKTFPKLFNGFDLVAPGAFARQGEVLVVGTLRQWMDTFCTEVADYLRNRATAQA